MTASSQTPEPGASFYLGAPLGVDDSFKPGPGWSLPVAVAVILPFEGRGQMTAPSQAPGGI